MLTNFQDFNCNSFTNDCVGFLTGQSIPAWIKGRIWHSQHCSYCPDTHSSCQIFPLISCLHRLELLCVPPSMPCSVALPRGPPTPQFNQVLKQPPQLQLRHRIPPSHRRCSKQLLLKHSLLTVHLRHLRSRNQYRVPRRRRRALQPLPQSTCAQIQPHFIIL